jgi:hypothetical protein
MNFENRALILLLAAVLLISLISCGDKNETETEEQEEYMMTSLDYEYKTDVSAYAEILNTTSDACLILANKTCLVGENYVPDKVIKLDTDYTFGGKNPKNPSKIPVSR